MPVAIGEYPRANWNSWVIRNAAANVAPDADLLRRAGRHSDARHAYQRALDLAQTDPERRFLRDRVAELKLSGATQSCSARLADPG